MSSSLSPLAPTYTLSDLQSDASSGEPSAPGSGRQSPQSCECRELLCVLV